MVVDQNFPKVKKYFLSIILIILFSSKSFSENFKYTKIVKLKNPWSATFINNNEIIITEKEGKIKIIDLISKKISSI
jgi:quinoprotein glucose dehydrogenase